METLLDHPLAFFVLSLLVLWLSVQVGAFIRKRRLLPEDERDDFALVVNASLTLLALIIGFTFSMAVSRYDQRKNLEEQEANAIGTEYLRVDMLPPADAAKIRSLLRLYLDKRIQYYAASDQESITASNAATFQLQNQLWATVVAPVKAQPTPLTALVVAGMNDVLNAQGYAQAARWNRIPAAAWILLITISVFCNLLIGYGVRLKSELLFLILPVVLSVSLFLIADIDSPSRGVIHVRSENLETLAESLRSQ